MSARSKLSMMTAARARPRRLWSHDKRQEPCRAGLEPAAVGEQTAERHIHLCARLGDTFGIVEAGPDHARAERNQKLTNQRRLHRAVEDEQNLLAGTGPRPAETKRRSVGRHGELQFDRERGARSRNARNLNGAAHFIDEAL